MVVFLTDGVLRGEPEVLLNRESIFEAASREGLNRGVLVVHALQNAGAFKIIDGLAHRRSVLAGKEKLCLARSRNAEFGVLVNIAVSMTGDCNRLLPGAHIGLD